MKPIARGSVPVFLIKPIVFLIKPIARGFVPVF